MDRYIPNARWLGVGIAATFYIVSTMERMIWFDSYLVIGLLVSCTFLILHNPKPDPNLRLDLAFCVSILALMWPVILLTLVLEKPWNSPKWKNRLNNDSDKGKKPIETDAEE